MHLGKGKQRIKKIFFILVYMLTHDIFVELDFQVEYPQMNICHVFKKTMIMGTNIRFSM